MRNNKFILLLSAIFLGLAIKSASAVTFPSGTVFTVRLGNTISSRDVGGKRFLGELLEDIPGRGGFSVARGLSVAGVVQSPRVEVASSVRPLTLILTSFNYEGHNIPIKTQPYEVHNAGVMGRGGNVRFTGGAFVLPPGTVLQFRLRQAFTL
jgi:hypothetical protein